MLAKHRIRLMVEPRLVAKLGHRRSIERGEQRIEQPDILLARGRKLEQHRTQPFAQDRYALAENPGQPDTVESLR